MLPVKTTCKDPLAAKNHIVSHELYLQVLKP